jgi:hypothetical protein
VVSFFLSGFQTRIFYSMSSASFLMHTTKFDQQKF